LSALDSESSSTSEASLGDAAEVEAPPPPQPATARTNAVSAAESHRVEPAERVTDTTSALLIMFTLNFSLSEYCCAGASNRATH